MDRQERRGYRIDLVKLRVVRSARGWSQWDLSHYSGVRTVPQIENGDGWVSFETAVRFCKALDVPFDELVVAVRGRDVLDMDEGTLMIAASAVALRR